MLNILILLFISLILFQKSNKITKKTKKDYFNCELHALICLIKGLTNGKGV